MRTGATTVVSAEKKYRYVFSKSLQSVSHLTHQLRVDLGYTINSAWPLHTQIRSGVFRGGWTEGTDCAGDKHTQTMFVGYI